LEVYTMKRMKKWTIAAITMLSMVLFAGMASAHVTVQPKETTQGSYEVFTVRVPSEKENVTTKSVKVRVPEGFTLSRTQPKPGWKTELEKSADGAITSVTWTAEGAGLSQTEFDEFRIQGKVAADAKELAWKAYQTYSDGSVVEWTGAPDADYPASVTTVNPGTGAGDGHGAATAPASSGTGQGTAAGGNGGVADTSSPSPDAAAAVSNGGSSTKETVALILSIAGLVFGAAALTIALAKRRV
jgi:uncharacterized protein YcnI